MNESSFFLEMRGEVSLKLVRDIRKCRFNGNQETGVRGKKKHAEEYEEVD